MKWDWARESLSEVSPLSTSLPHCSGEAATKWIFSVDDGDDGWSVDQS